MTDEAAGTTSLRPFVISGRLERMKRPFPAKEGSMDRRRLGAIAGE
jgi:hypothetical protein